MKSKYKHIYINVLKYMYESDSHAVVKLSDSLSCTCPIQEE